MLSARWLGEISQDLPMSSVASRRFNAVLRNLSKSQSLPCARGGGLRSKTVGLFENFNFSDVLRYEKRWPSHRDAHLSQLVRRLQPFVSTCTVLHPFASTYTVLQPFRHGKPCHLPLHRDGKKRNLSKQKNKIRSDIIIIPSGFPPSVMLFCLLVCY